MDELTIKRHAQILEKLNNQPIVLEIDGQTLFAVFAQLQLALRHPSNKGETSRVTRNFALKLQEMFCQIEPRAREICDAGWQSELDVDVEPSNEMKCDRFSRMSFDIQREILITYKGLSIAIGLLGEFSHDDQFWMDYVYYLANNIYKNMSIKEIETEISDLDSMKEQAD